MRLNKAYAAGDQISAVWEVADYPGLLVWKEQRQPSQWMFAIDDGMPLEIIPQRSYQMVRMLSFQAFSTRREALQAANIASIMLED